jgi:hypothetical protein
MNRRRYERMDGGGRSKGFEFARGGREKIRGQYRFSSLMKQKKRGRNCAVFCFPEKEFFLYIYMM